MGVASMQRVSDASCERREEDRTADAGHWPLGQGAGSRLFGRRRVCGDDRMATDHRRCGPEAWPGATRTRSGRRWKVLRRTYSMPAPG